MDHFNTHSTTYMMGVLVMVALVLGLSGRAMAQAPPPAGPLEYIQSTLEDILIVIGNLQTDVSNLSAKAGESNHTLRWDQLLDSTDGDATTGCNSERFKCIFPTTAFPDGEAVLDMQTGLVWDRSPHDTRGDTDIDADEGQTWFLAKFHCINRMIGGQRGQRLPSFAELASLGDPKNPSGNPDLPPGHPFIGVQSAPYWSATAIADSSTTAWRVSFASGNVAGFPKTVDEPFAWCVRGGHNDADAY